MSDYNTRNYTEQGGEKTVIGGELVIEAGAELKVKSGATFTNENDSGEEETVKIPYMAASSQSTGSNVAKDLSALITLLKAAGLMNTAAPTITVSVQPEDAACAVNGTVSLSVTAASSDGRSLGYQWYSNTTNSNSDGTLISGATSRTYTVPTTTNGTYYYYCVVGRATCASVTSSVAVVTIE